MYDCKLKYKKRDNNMPTLNYNAQERLSIRGSLNYLIFVALIGYSSVLLQVIAGIKLKSIAPIFIFASTVTSIAYYIYYQRKQRKDPNLACWIVSLISISAPIFVKYSYTQTLDWTYAAMSYHATTMIFTLLIMIQFLQKKKIFIVNSIIVFINWILFLFLASQNNAIIHAKSYINGAVVHSGVVLPREIMFLVLGCILTYAGYRTISVIFKYEIETVSQNKIIENQQVELRKYTTGLEDKVKERTEELNAAMEELAAINDNLTETRDALWGEMEIAKKIQTVLVPERPMIHGYDITAIMTPADEVGGDYYDVINVGDINWTVIGDVSGHGVPAGLVMMMVQTVIHVVLAKFRDINPSELLTTVNKTIAENIKLLGEDKYMTLTVFSLEKDGEFTFSGLHQDILIYRSKTGDVESVPTEGMWIGILDDVDGMNVDSSLKLEIGDTMLLYTDGITEALKVDNDNEMYGDEQLVDALKLLGKESTTVIKEGIISSLDGYKCNDDVTMVVLKRKE